MPAPVEVRVWSMMLPIDEANTWRVRSQWNPVSVRVTPELLRISVSTARRYPSCSSTEIENGSISQGEVQVDSYLYSGARTTSYFFAMALARAMEIASAAVDCKPPGVRSSVAANPQHPSASTRMPTPIDSAPDTVAARPFLVVRPRSVDSTTRTSA